MRPAAPRPSTRSLRSRPSGRQLACALLGCLLAACQATSCDDPHAHRTAVERDSHHGADPDVVQTPAALRSLATESLARATDGLDCAAAPDGHDSWEIGAEPCLRPRPHTAALAARLDTAPDTLRVDETFGVPTFVWLSQPSREHAPVEQTPEVDPFDLGGAVGNGDPTTTNTTTPDPLDAPSGLPIEREVAEAAARAALVEHAALWDLSVELVAGLEITHVHDTGRGAVVVRMQRRVDGAPVWGQRVAVILDRGLDPVAISGHVSPLRADALEAAPALGARDALAVALASTGADLSIDTLDEIDPHAGYRRFAAPDTTHRAHDGSALRAPARLQRVVYPLPASLVPAWYVEIELDLASARRGFVGLGLVIDARDGRLLARRELVHDESSTDAWAHVDADGRPWSSPYHAQRTSHAGAEPRDQAPRQVSLHGDHPLGDRWLLAGATETRGNHVDAYSDATGDNGLDAGDRRASVIDGASGRWDPNQAPLADAAAHDAPLVQMFYTVNRLHDLFYRHGFDETAGTAQLENHGRGGAQGDPLRAESADASGTDNANIYVPADGASPRLQMYIYERGTWASIDSPAGRLPAARAERPAHFEVDATLVSLLDEARDGCAPMPAQARGAVALLRRGGCGLPELGRQAMSAGLAGVVVVDESVERPVDQVAVLTGFDAAQDVPVLVVGATAGEALAAHAGSTVQLRALPAQDGALDSELVTHEWAHYLFERLAGTAPDTAQTAALNEGNSDLVALLTHVPAGHPALSGAPWPLVTWAGRRHQFGMRRLPYATDPAINPLTFAHIAADARLPTTAPMSPLAWTLSPASAHAAGEVWALAMWEVATSLIAEHGDAQGRARMLDALVVSLASLPPRATFVEARDTVLAALFAGDRRDFELGWRAFARRGLGAGAVAPDRHSDDLTGVVEDFAEGGRLSVGHVTVDDAAHGCDGDGVLDAGESAVLRVPVTNTGSVALTDVAVRFEIVARDGGEPLDARLADGGVATVTRLGPMESVDVALEVTLGEVGALTPAVLVATADHPDVAAADSRREPVFVHADEVDSSARCEGFETNLGAWTTDVAVGAAGASAGWRRVESDLGGRAWFAPAPPTTSDARLTSPLLRVSTARSFVIEIEHRYELETGPGGHAFDGGVLEVSTDGGQTWLDAAAAGAEQAPYGVMIADLGALVGAEPSSVNPLADRAAFGGRNASHPGTDRARFDFGTRLAGLDVRLRLRLATDGEVGRDGWTVAQIGVTGVDNRPFASWVADDGVCGARRGAALGAVCGGEEIALPPGQAWTQVGGASVQVGGDVFVAPRVEQDTVLRFESAAADGEVAELAVLVHGWRGGEEHMGDGVRLPAPADAAPTDCACAVRGGQEGGRAPWAIVGLLGLVGLGMRRARRAPR